VDSLTTNTDPKIAETARFLMPTEVTDANVSVPLFVNAADPIEARASAISAHVVDAVLRRTCRDTLLSLPGLVKRNVLASKVRSVMRSLGAFGLKALQSPRAKEQSVEPPDQPRAPPTVPALPSPTARKGKEKTSIQASTQRSPAPPSPKRSQREVLEERRRLRLAMLEASPLRPKRDTLHIDLTK
jgi:hypothetical protein